jgi:hypothetical protein
MVSIWTHKEESKLSFLLQHYHNINLPYLNTTGEEYTREGKTISSPLRGEDKR